MTTLVLATRNAHKVQEIRAILGEPFRYLTLNDFPDAPTVVEDAATFAGNAEKKAMQLAKWLVQSPVSNLHRETGHQLYVLADDSGLEVDALNGAPGVHSARFVALDVQGAGDPRACASGNSPDAANNAKLLRLLEKVPLEKLAARFCCVLALAEFNSQWPITNCQLFDGVCEGRISLSPGGQGGFGYDPLFVPRGHHQSFAELGEEVKNQLSHRAKALKKLRVWMLRA